MAIKGLTTDREPTFPRVGILRKGSKKPNEKQPGKDLTFFRFDTDNRQAEADFAAAYASKDGKIEPAEINCYLPFPTPDENFQAWKEEYRAGGLVHRCDGETMTVWATKDGKYSTTPAPCPYAGKAESGCKPVGRLTLIIPELRRLAYVTLGTTSKHDIMEITDNINAVYALSGTLTGIPFKLCRRPRMISMPKADGTRARYEKWMVTIEVDPAWASQRILTMQQSAGLIAPPARVMLTDGRRVTIETGEIIDDEPDDFTLADVDPLDFSDAPPTPTDEFLAITSQQPGMVNGHPAGTNGNGNGDGKLPKPILRKLHAVGTQLYGADWDAKRYELVQTITKNTATSSSDLTEQQAHTLIVGMEKKLQAAAATVAA